MYTCVLQMHRDLSVNVLYLSVKIAARNMLENTIYFSHWKPNPLFHFDCEMVWVAINKLPPWAL